MATTKVTTGGITDATIATADIADDAVTAAKLANTSVTAASYGSATAIPAITVDAQGRITAASTNSVTSTTINSNADNRLITGSGTANTLNGESTLTYNGSGTFEISDNGSAYILTGPGTTKHEIAASASDNHLVIQNNKSAGNITSDIIFKGSGSGGATVSEKMRITTTGVGINHDTSGASSNAALTIKNRVSSSATRFNLVNTGSSSTESTQIFSQNNELAFTASGSERFRITSGGVLFNGDTASANKLDDYEEGTFTPTMTFDTHQANPAGSFTGQYQKIGNCVHFHARFALTDEGSGMNSIHLSNLPFTPNVSSYTHPIATFYAEQGVNTTNGNSMVFGRLVTNAYQFKLTGIHGGGSMGHFHMNMTTDTAIFGLYGFYFTS